jgi:hypothetical protein
MKTRNVLLDAEVFVTNNFDIRSRVFERLKELAAEDRVVVFLTEVTVREVENRIRKNVEAAGLWFKRVKKEARILMAIENSTFDISSGAYQPEEIIEQLTGSFRSFLDSVNAEIIPNSMISLPDVLDAYFNASAPFAAGDKQKEFPDAFTVSAASKWAEDKEEDLYFVSADKDIESACSTSEHLHHLTRVQNFLDLESRHHSDNGWITEELSGRIEELKRGLADSYQDGSGFYLDDVDGDIEDIEVTISDIDNIDLIEVNEDSAEVEVSLSFELTAHVTYPDPDMTHYDSEDKQVYVFGHINKSIERTYTQAATLSLELNRRDRAIESIGYSTPRSIGVEAEEDDWPYK